MPFHLVGVIDEDEDGNITFKVSLYRFPKAENFSGSLNQQMADMNLLYLTFGDSPAVHWQACFSILSFLARAPRGNAIVVMTDCPAAYALFEKRIKIITVDEPQLRAWRGSTDNFFRVKIKALEACIAQSSGEAWLYLDSDTFLFKDFQSLQHTLERGCPLLHLREGRLSDLKSKSIRQMWSRTKNRHFDGIHFGREAAMWNAGVVGIPGPDAAEVIAKVLRVCDNLCREKIRPRLVEQLSFSVVLPAFGELWAAEEWVAHYWSNKAEWGREIAAFFVGCFLEKLDFRDVLEKMRTFDFQKIPVQRKVRKTKRRLWAWAEKLFPDQIYRLDGCPKV